VRKRRGRTVLGKESPWVFEVGIAPQQFNPETGSLGENTNNPQFLRKDSKLNFEWRVRNLPYPPETYSVTVDPADRKIVVRTANKKYYKRFGIPELDHLQRPLEDAALRWQHANHTLHITYIKPAEVVQAERDDQRELKNVKKSTAMAGLGGAPAGDEPADCKQQ
jgi:hypothetical protein